VEEESQHLSHEKERGEDFGGFAIPLQKKEWKHDNHVNEKKDRAFASWGKGAAQTEEKVETPHPGQARGGGNGIQKSGKKTLGGEKSLALLLGV